MSVLSIESPWLICGFWKVDKSYLQYVYHDLVDNWVHRNFRGPTCANEPGLKSVPRASIVAVLAGLVRDNKLHDHPQGSDRVFPRMKRPPRRSPYAEFFDHPFLLSTFDLDAESQLRFNPSGCHLSAKDRSFASSPINLIDLNEIRMAAHSHLAKQISRDSSKQFRTGWTGSLRVGSSDVLSNGQNETQMRYFVGGFIGELHTSSANSSVAAISDSVCQVPVSILEKEPSQAAIGDFILTEVDSIVVSCLCLGSTKDMNHQNNVCSGDRRESIPLCASLPALYSNEKGRLGGCSIIVLNDRLFITAVHIHCHKHHIFGKNASSSKNKTERFLQIEMCLAKQRTTVEPSEPAESKGMLTRRHFQCKMNRNGTYKCCKLFISSLPEDEPQTLESDNSCLQELELILSFVPNTARTLKLSEKMDYLWPNGNLSESQKILGSSFWVLGDSGQTCALTIGGSEDIVAGSSCSSLAVHVIFPTSSLHVTQQGYILSYCTHGQLDALVTFQHKQKIPTNDPATTKQRPSFDFEGGSKIAKGILHRRPRRRNMFHHHDNSTGRVVGEMLARPSSAIPLCALSYLFDAYCIHLRNPNESSTFPSLVRRISCGRLLSVSFCKVQCCCTRCYCALVDSRNQRPTLGDDPEEPSFWHLRNPGDEFQSGNLSKLNSPDTNELPSYLELSSLRCPNKCPVNFSGVKWEASGIIDDGTGQATIYADGDVALTLLGMSSEDTKLVEQVIWFVPAGTLIFKKSIPPSADLRKKVTDFLAKNKVTEPIRLMPIHTRAKYLLEKHCRSSSVPCRPLDFYIRCKPLPERSRNLHHTIVDSFFVDNNGSGSIFRETASSYTLPSLKLQLVDCGVPSFERPALKGRFSE